MDFSDDQIDGLGVALNEATLISLEVDPERRLAWATFLVLSLPEEGPPPDDRRVLLLFSPVGRVAASLRHGRWDDRDARVETFTVEWLPAVAQSFQTSIYGRQFLDVPEAEYFSRWSDRLSLDFRSDTDGLSHTIDLSQDGGLERSLDIRLWFDDLVIRSPDRREISIDEFIAGGRRWWDAWSRDDPRTQDAGIFRLAP